MLPECECNDEKDSYLVNGDVLVKPNGNLELNIGARSTNSGPESLAAHYFETYTTCSLSYFNQFNLDQKQTRGIWGPSKLWTEVQSGGKYIIPYRSGLIGWS